MAKKETYEEFVDKFKPKKTTDDCYTPPEVYDLIVDHVNRHVMPLEGHRVLRPFYPGGDYERAEYLPGDVVIDNPPFSIFIKIVRFYQRRGVPFFLFAPALTCGSCFSVPGVTAICTHVSVIYENGAKVNTSFVTNMMGGTHKMIVDGPLCRKLEELQKKDKPDKRKSSLSYDPHLITPAIAGKLAKRGIYFELSSDQCIPVGHVGECQYKVFGSGLLLSDRLATERMAAERMAAERMAAERMAAERQATRERIPITLTAEELAIIEKLNETNE